MRCSRNDLRTRSVRHLADLLRCERAALSDFLVALADFHRRRLWLELGHSSLFYFLHRELGLSSGAAFYRKTAAELIQKFPEIIEPLRDGRLCLTSVVELAKVLTPENREDVLPRFFHLSKSGAKAVSAALRPDEAAPHRDVVTAVRAQVAAATLPLSGRAEVEPAREPPFHLDETPRANSRPDPLPPASPPRTGIEPLTAELSRLHVTVSSRLLAKLEAKTDHVPAHVKRAVWKRDGGRCQWPVHGGGVCGSTHQVELDHITPRGRGGLPTIENTRCLCRVHNQYAARQVYGDAWMDRFTRTAAPPSRDGADASAPP